MNMTKSYRISLFTLMYVTQGLLMSYFLTFNILYLSEFGYTESEVGIFQAVLAVPFVLKVFLGMLSDRVNLFNAGHRKPYMIIGLLTQVAGMAIMPFIPVADGLGLFAAIAFVIAIGMALYDTCTDGLALDITPDEEYGLVQGMMVGGRAFGILLLLVTGGFIVDAIGWQWVFLIAAAFPVLPLFFVMRLQEDPTTMRREPFSWGAFRSFGQGIVLLAAVMGLLYSLAIDGVFTFLSLHLRETMAQTVGTVGLLVALAMVGRIVGALTAGRIADMIGHRQSLFVAIALTTLGCVGLAVGGGIGLIAVSGFLFGLAYGYYTSTYNVVAMDLSDPRIAASMFAIFMMFVNIGTVGGQALGGVLTESLGFGRMVLVLGAINLLNIPLVFAVFRQRQQATTPA